MPRDSMTQRQAFEFWYSDQGKYPEAVETDRGQYLLMQAALAWKAWKAACEWALEDQPLPPV